MNTDFFTDAFYHVFVDKLFLPRRNTYRLIYSYRLPLCISSFDFIAKSFYLGFGSKIFCICVAVSFCQQLANINKWAVYGVSSEYAVFYRPIVRVPIKINCLKQIASN